MDARRLRFAVMLAVALGVVGLSLALGLSGGGEQAGVAVKGQEVGPGTWRLIRGSSALVFTVPAGLRMRYAYGGSASLCDPGHCNNPALLFDVVNHDVSICVDAVTGNDCSDGARLVKQNDGTWKWTRSTNSGENSQYPGVLPMVEALIGSFYASTRIEQVP